MKKTILFCVVVLLCLISIFYIFNTKNISQSSFSLQKIDLYSTNELQRLVKKNSDKLWKINREFEKKYKFNLYGAIAQIYKNKWACKTVIANFYNLWYADILKNDKSFLYTKYSPLINVFIWNLSVGNHKKITTLPSFNNEYLEKAKEMYLTKNISEYKYWLISQINSEKLDKYINIEYCRILESIGLYQNDYTLATRANIMLNSIYSNNLINLEKKLNYVSNIARYSAIINKVNINARNAIINYTNCLEKYPDIKKELSKYFKQQCIVDVVKKYDLLNGKPKDGYYYPVNDMKIKVESD